MRRISKAVFITIALFIIYTISATAASIQQGPMGKCSLKLSGEINESTDGDLAAAYKSLSDGHPEKCTSLHTLFLDSNGGDVGAAIRAGDFIRQKKFSTMVDTNDSCASACVLLFLGGVDRLPAGQIGLHRPYSQNYSTSDSEARDTYESINSQIRQYLIRMYISEGLLDKMNSVSPSQVKWFDPRNDSDFHQLEELQIIGKDPVFEGQKDSVEAKKIGISKREYYLRQQRANSICYNYDQSIVQPRQIHEQSAKCYWDVMYGRR